MYDVNYFIAKFEAIPENNWCMGVMHDGDSSCAVGHRGAEPNKELKGEAKAFVEVIYKSLKDGVFHINDNKTNQYPQPTPKQRILAALYDIRDKELSEANVMLVNKIINDSADDSSRIERIPQFEVQFDSE